MMGNALDKWFSAEEQSALLEEQSLRHVSGFICCLTLDSARREAKPVLRSFRADEIAAFWGLGDDAVQILLRSDLMYQVIDTPYRFASQLSAELR